MANWRNFWNWGGSPKKLTNNSFCAKFLSRITERWKGDDQILFFQSLYELQKDGLALNPSLHFLTILIPGKTKDIRQIAQHIHQGGLLASALDQLPFPKRYIGRLALAQRSSFLTHCLGQVAKEEAYRQKTLKQLRQLMAYPLLLLCVVGLIIWFVRWLLLPQLENLMTPDIRQKHLLVNILLFSLEELPLISGTFFLLVFIFAYLIYLHYLRLSQMAQLIWLHHWPVIRHLQEDYLSWQFTLELSALLEQGISLKEALEQLRDPTMRPAIRCIAKHLTTEAIKGRQMSDSLQDLPFLRQDLGLVIRQGDMLSQEATKLRLLAEKYFEDFTNRFKRLLLFVQPLLFSIVALLIMSIYLILLMPMLTILDQGF